ncbi:MAG: DUF2815 family protein [Candidatus Hamiltonella defensa (Ceratovacuna japonica)]
MATQQRKVVTGEVRGSYVNVFNTRLNDLSGKEEYSMMILIPKEDKETVAHLKKAIKAAIDDKWGAKCPANLRHPLRDGDSEADLPDTVAAGEEPYAGHYFMNLKSFQKPGIVDVNVQPVIDESDFRSGDYCRVSINAYAYDQKGNKGVAFGLNNIQVLRKGQPLGGVSRAENDFDVVTQRRHDDEMHFLDAA